MKLRSGNLTKKYDRPQVKQRTTRMTDPTNPNVDVVPQRTITTIDTVVSQVVSLPLLANTIATMSTVGAIPLPISQAPPVSPRPVMATTLVIYLISILQILFMKFRIP